MAGYWAKIRTETNLKLLFEKFQNTLLHEIGGPVPSGIWLDPFVLGCLIGFIGSMYADSGADKNGAATLSMGRCWERLTGVSQVKFFTVSAELGERRDQNFLKGVEKGTLLSALMTGKANLNHPDVAEALEGAQISGRSFALIEGRQWRGDPEQLMMAAAASGWASLAGHIRQLMDRDVASAA